MRFVPCLSRTWNEAFKDYWYVKSVWLLPRTLDIIFHYTSWQDLLRVRDSDPSIFEDLVFSHPTWAKAPKLPLAELRKVKPLIWCRRANDWVTQSRWLKERGFVYPGISAAPEGYDAYIEGLLQDYDDDEDDEDDDRLEEYFF